MPTKKTGKPAPAKKAKLQVSDLKPRKDAKGGGRHAEGKQRNQSQSLTRPR